MLIDPDMSGCTLWFGDSVQHIKGTPIECIDRIVNFFNSRSVDLTEKPIISLDATGIGRAYADYLDRLNIKYNEIHGRKFMGDI